MNASLDNILRLLRAGKAPEAEAESRKLLAHEPRNAHVAHLHGLALRQLGRLEAAQALLARAVELEPTNAEFHSNLANLLAARGEFDASLTHFARATTLAPNFRPALLGYARTANRAARGALGEQIARRLIALGADDAEAWSALGAALSGQHQTSSARAALERAVALAPRYGAARYQLASVLAEEEESERALTEVDAARNLGIDHRGIVITRARALVQLDRYDEADAQLTTWLTQNPADVDAQFLLAQLRHVGGDADFARTYRAAALAANAPIPLLAGYADLMRMNGEHSIAEELLRDLLARHGPVAGLASSLGTVLHAQGRLTEAVAVARNALGQQPDDATIAENYVVALLSNGEADAALPVVERYRATAPLDQRWITYRGDIARQKGDALFEEWCDPVRVVRVYDLPAPAEHSIASFHDELRPLLAARHHQARHPLDQSLRAGTQTSRGLLRDQERVVRRLLESFAAPLAAYQAEIGAAPLHPLTSRNNTPATLSGCWSVQLRCGGFHVNHIHPQGWISSAYYVNVPAEVDDAASRSGWLRFGEPHFAAPGATPTAFVQPRPGRLVLFPSYLWHGTTPLTKAEPRLAVAFDALPRMDVST